MDAITLLLERRSEGRLEGPPPTSQQLDILYRAALRAPDHGELRPWRFIEYSGAGLDRLGDAFARAVQADDPEASDKALEKARGKPLRAPMVIAVIASPRASKKIPRSEQLLSAGCAAHAILYAASAQGLGAMWRTGDFTYHEVVRGEMGLAADDEVVGFIYIGQAKGARRIKPLDPQAYVTRVSD
ncbi:nitroreductase family protein [Kushneria aurantia]|uniref:Putative NAD(P)H nitroreductase n=1 Tax=Kushneria aurantia TaxID=504092 RepID=A0ABV6G3V5_9GAMM|nr:nitroreductase family protein [Kushneria aurantia]